MSNPFSARWTTEGNNLCLGQWEICYRGTAVALGAERRDRDMGTFGIYSYIFPDDEDLAEGLCEDDWIRENAHWLAGAFAANAIPVDEQHMRWFFRAVNAHDWRCGSCGGCL